jgi:hypothetical protein
MRIVQLCLCFTLFASLGWASTLGNQDHRFHGPIAGEPAPKTQVTVAYAPSLGGTVIGLEAEPGTARTDALMQLLLSRFHNVRLIGESDYRSFNGIRVVDGDFATTGRGNSPGWPDFKPTLGTRNDVTILIGDACQAAADAHGLLGSGAESCLPLSTVAVWTGLAPGLPPELQGEPFGGRGRLLSPLTPELLGHVTPPLLTELEGATKVGVSVVGQDASGDDVALVWNQGNIINFAPGGPISSMEDDWSELLLGCVALAVGCPPWIGNYPWIDTTRSPTPSNAVQADLDVLGVAPDSPSFLPTLVEALRASELEERARARRLLEDYTGVRPNNPYFGPPKPGASWAVWAEYLRSTKGTIVYEPRDRTWHRDGQAESDPGTYLGATAIERTAPGYEFPRDKLPPILWARGFREPISKATTPSEIDSILARLGRTTPTENLIWPLVSSAEKRPKAASGVDLAALHAVGIARSGPSEFRSLEDIAEMVRPFSDELLIRVARASRGFPPRQEILPGELEQAFRLMAWHEDADDSFFSMLAVQLEGFVEEVLTDEGRVRAALAEVPDLEIGRSRRVGQSRARAFELLTALKVGGQRGRLDGETCARLESIASRFGHSDEIHLAREAANALAGWNDELGASLSFEMLKAHLAEDPSRSSRYLGPAPFGQAGMLLALDSISELEPSHRSYLRWELSRWVSRDPDWIMGLLAKPESFARGLLAIPLLWGTEIPEDFLGPDPLGDPLTPEQSLWVRREFLFALCGPSVDMRSGRDSLLALVGGTDPWSRSFACRSLRIPKHNQSPSELNALEQLAGGDDPVLADLAQEALVHRARIPGWQIAAVLESTQDLEPEFGCELTSEHAWRDLESVRLSHRTKAAYYLAKNEGADLLRALHLSDGLAAERVARIENEIAEEVTALGDVMDEEFGPGPATKRLAQLGKLALGEFEFGLAYIKRYDHREIAYCLREMQADAWSIHLSSLQYSNGFGFVECEPDVVDFGDKQELVAPFYAMGFAHDVVLAPNDIKFTVALDGTPSEKYVSLWRNLGAPGKAALRELATYPNERVVHAASTMLAAL